jgi:hypothetical protein
LAARNQNFVVKRKEKKQKKRTFQKSEQSGDVVLGIIFGIPRVIGEIEDVEIDQIGKSGGQVNQLIAANIQFCKFINN